VQCGATTLRPAADIIGGIGIVAANLAISGIAIDHRIHVTGGHAEEQVGFAEQLESFGRIPVGLGNDSHAVALRLQQAADDRHAEAGMIHIGIAGDDDDVAAVPAEQFHFGA